MDRRRAAGALLALAACIACSSAAPTASNQTALELSEGPSEGCYYNFQHYGEGDRIMTNEPCLNCTCHNRMLMCYLRVCPFTKPIGQDCTIEKRADQCCPIVTCPDVPVDLLTSTSTSSPAEYGATGLGKVDKYGCSINGKYFSEGSKVPPIPNKPCEHCYCIRNMTTCVMQECTLHVDGCTPIYHKDVCCPVRYSCDHLDDEMLLLDDMTTTVRPTPGFLLTTTTTAPVTQMSQDCVHDDQIFADGALIKTEKACEHCYCMKGDIVCVVQECGTPMENEGKNCTSLPPRQGQCCPDTYICEGDEQLTEVTTGTMYEELTTYSPPRRVEGSGYRNEPDEPYTEIPTFEGSGDDHATTLDSSDMYTSQKQTPQIIDEVFAATEESLKPNLVTIEPDKEQNTVPDDSNESTTEHGASITTQPTVIDSIKETEYTAAKTTISDDNSPTESSSFVDKEEESAMTTEPAPFSIDSKITEPNTEIEAKTTESLNIISELTTKQTILESSTSEDTVLYEQEDKTTTLQPADVTTPNEIFEPSVTTTQIPKDDSVDLDTKGETDMPITHDKEDSKPLITTTEPSETTSVNPVENEIDEDILPPGRIPGEGDCLLNGITYKNNTSVPNINNCHSSCRCVSSIVKCDPIICSPPPEHIDNMNDCQPIYDSPDACCPTYVCHSRETIPPESHSQMSGTESPKATSEKHDVECHDNKCQPHETKPTPIEPCTSKNCKHEIEDKYKCTTEGCEQTEIGHTSPPLKYPEGCVGDTCLTSEESCNGGKCQVPVPNKPICDNNEGCQASETCVGDNCVVGPQNTVPIDESSGCKDSEACKSSDTSTCKGPHCVLNVTPSEDAQNQDETIECTGESCRRKEQTQAESKPPSECLSPDCIAQEDESSLLTTESPMKDQIYKESTTESVNDGYSKTPELEITPTGETDKITHIETAVTEKQDTISELSTDKTMGVTLYDSEEQFTDKEKTYTDPSEPHTSKIQETSTEIYKTPDSEDHLTTEFEKQVTEIIEQEIKDVPTEYPFVVLEEHRTESPKEDVVDKLKEPSSTISSIDSTEIIDIQPQVQENVKETVTDSTITEEFTEKQDSLTNRPTIQENDVSGQEYIDKNEMYTESPKEPSTQETMPHMTEPQEPTQTEIQQGYSTETEVNILMTESSATLSPEISTEKYADGKVQEDKVKYTEDDNEVINVPGKPITTEQTISVEISSEPYVTVLGETVTDKTYAGTEKEQIITDIPVTFTEITPIDTTLQDLHKIEEKPQSTPTDKEETLPINEDTDKESVKPSTHDLQKETQLPETHETITSKPQVYTTSGEMLEYMTSVTSEIYTTEPSASEADFEKAHDIIDTNESEIPDSSIKESLPTIATITQDVDLNEVITEQPELAITSTSKSITEAGDLQHISSATAPELLEDTSVNDLTEPSTAIPVSSLAEDTTTKDSSLSGVEQTTTNIVQVVELEMTSESDKATHGFETTITSHSIEDSSTKQKETEPELEHGEITTLIPEIHSTKLDETSSMSTDAQKKTIQTSTSSPEEGEATTETLKQSDEDEGKITDHPSTNIQTQAVTTEVPVKLYTDIHGDSTGSTVHLSVDESEIEGTSTYSTPGTMPEDHVTKDIESDIPKIDSEKDKYKPTEHTTINEMVSQQTITHAPETTSQDTETKLVTETQTDKEIPATELVHKGESTESPLSLVTKADESTNAEDGTRISVLDKTTQHPHVNIPDEDKIKIPTDVETQVSSKEPTQMTESEIKFDTVTQSNTPYAVDVLHESTPATPVKESTEEQYNTEEQETSTEYSQTLASMTTVTYDTKPHSAVKEDTTEETIQHEDSQTTEILKDDTEEDHTVTNTPDLLTTKDFNILDKTTDKQTDDYKPIKDEENTVLPEQHITTEKIMISEQPLHHDSPTIEDQERFTNEVKATTSMYQDLTTHVKDNELKLTNEPESTVSILATTSGILTTESSEVTRSEEEHKVEYEQPDELTTEKQKIPESPDTVSNQEKENTETTEEPISFPEKESTTKISPNEEFEHKTLRPQATVTNILMQTETNPVQEVPTVTESIHQQTVIDQGSTTISDSELSVSEDVQTELPIIVSEKDQTEKTTAHEVLIRLPVDTMVEETPSEYTTVQESQTEISRPKETVTSGPKETPLETETEISAPADSDTSVPTATEPSILKDTATTTPDIPESVTLKDSSQPAENEAYVPDVTEVSFLEKIETSVPEVTKTSVITESSVPDSHETSVTKEIEGFESETSEGTAAEVTESSIPEATDTLPEVTEPVPSIFTESSLPKETYSEFIDQELESSTYKSKDEKSETTEVQSPAIEFTNPSSETTPYLVELQEHTTKTDEDISSVTTTEEGTTRSPDTYQTERGDQPLDTPDKFAQENFQQEHITKETFTKTDEKLTTLGPEQTTENPIEVRDKTEKPLEESLVSSESPIPSALDSEIGSSTVPAATTSSIALVPVTEPEKYTTATAEIETTTHKKDLPIDTEKIPEQEVIRETTASEDEPIPTITKATTIKTSQEMSTQLPVSDDKFIKPEDKFTETYPTIAPELPKPGFTEMQSTEEIPAPDFPPSEPSGYGQEPDYVEEDQAFGPGTCRYGGKVYVSAQQIPRDDPCDFCFCFRSDIICLQQSCPPPIHGCHEEPIQGFCCPRYECPVSMATTLNVTTTTTTTTTTLPPHFLPHAYKGAAQRRGCQIKGHSYKVGEVVRASSGPCLHCTCGGDGQMKCDPKACTPEPMLRQMIAAAVSAKRRR